jgi:hypothetical protein|tara:strand:- start:255 stop:413 length:159 start_codon:yes stop_codon:yes gene_type:complete
MTNSDQSDDRKGEVVKSAKVDARHAREAMALRENLKRRKEQVKARESALKKK